MITTEFNPKAAYLITKTIYFSLIIGVVLFLIVALLTINGSTFFKLDFDPIFLVAIILTCTAIPAGYLISKKSFTVNSDDPLSKKWPTYQVRLIIKMATCEGAGLFSIVGILLTSNLIFLIPLTICLLTMASYYPSPINIGQEIVLKQFEIDSLTQ